MNCGWKIISRKIGFLSQVIPIRHCVSTAKLHLTSLKKAIVCATETHERAVAASKGSLNLMFFLTEK